MSGRKYFCLCEANCKFETMSKEQIIAALAEATPYADVEDDCLHLLLDGEVAVDEDAAPGGERFSYAGENARTANSQTLGEAKGLEQMGVDAETIRQETGWFRGKDGKWRFEVDDSTTQVADNRINYMTLGELLPGAEIFKAYPNLEDVSVTFQSLEPGVNASYDSRFDTIDVDYKLKSDPDAVRAAVLHEIQHVVQRWEGFSKGTNIRAWERKIREGFDSRKATDIREAAEAERKLEQFRAEDPDLYRDMMELDAMAPDLPRGAMNWDTLEQIEEDPPEWQAYDARRDELEEIYGDRMWDFNSALYDLQRINKRAPRTAEELYWDTAGEIEARNVAARRNLTATQRKKTPPILGGENTVFAEGDGRSNQDRKTVQAVITGNYQKTVDQVLNMQNTRQNHVIIGYTPSIYEKMGMPSLPFVIGTGHIYSAAKTETEAKQDGNYHKSVNYHGLGDRIIKNIYEKLKDPVMIIASKDVSKNAAPMRSTHSIVAIVDVGNAQKSLLLPVEITAERTVDGVRMDVNALSSVYEKTVTNLVTEAIAQENSGEIGVFYAKKEALTLPGAGVQFPVLLQQSIASNGIVHRFPEKVNMNIQNATQSQQFKRWFGDWQNSPENASKVVDPDGTPLVMYHGTKTENGNFFVFDETKAIKKGGLGFKALGKGNYFTAQKLDGTERYGSRVISAYLDIKNPFVYNGGNSFKEQAANRLGVDSNISYDDLQKEMRRQGYDGVIQYDNNGAVAIAVTFDSNQIKSATDNVGTFDATNPDIRYSVDDGADPSEDDFAQVQAALKGKSRDWAENYLRNELGEEGYERYRKWEKQQAEQKKQSGQWNEICLRTRFKIKIKKCKNRY